MKCTRCHKNEANVSKLFGVLPCDTCTAQDAKKRKVTHAPEFFSISQQTRVQEQRDRYEGDMLPMYTTKSEINPEFARLHPAKAKELEEDLKRVKGS